MKDKFAQLDALIKDASHQSDRACALIYAANLDNRLKELIETFSIDVGKEFSKTVFEGTGPLSTFSSKISICFMLGLISKVEFHDLQIIRKIRNFFAHEEHGWDFDHKEISSRCQSFKLIQNMLKKSPLLSGSCNTPRDAFVICAGGLTTLLYARNLQTEVNKRQESKTHWLT